MGRCLRRIDCKITEEDFCAIIMTEKIFKSLLAFVYCSVSIFLPTHSRPVSPLTFHVGINKLPLPCKINPLSLTPTIDLTLSLALSPTFSWPTPSFPSHDILLEPLPPLLNRPPAAHVIRDNSIKNQSRTHMDSRQPCHLDDQLQVIRNLVPRVQSTFRVRPVADLQQLIDLLAEKGHT